MFLSSYDSGFYWFQDDEPEKVIYILNGNNYDPISSGVPSCGFDKNISLKVAGLTFAIACDTCNYIQDLGNLRYFDISQEDILYVAEPWKALPRKPVTYTAAAWEELAVRSGNFE